MNQARQISLESWSGLVTDDDPHANFKRDVALVSALDPVPTLEALADEVGLPVEVVCRYALVRWVSAGSEALLELGPTWVQRLREPLEQAEAQGTDDARLDAYRRVRGMLDWMAAGLEGPDGPP